ncbi:hypothetical protein ACP4OV_022077 [Aristida adscensionis]
MSSTTVSMELVVDTRSRRVLYAVAGRGAVYFLFSLLTMAVREQDLRDGSVGNLFSSFKKLDGDETNLQPFPPVPGDHDSCNLVGRLGTTTSSYAVMDDLTVVPASAVSGVVALALRASGLGAVEEKTVQLSSAEGYELWMASLRSKTVLTDVFLRRKTKKPPVHVAGRGSCFGIGNFCCCILVMPLMVYALAGLIGVANGYFKG